MFAAEVSIVYDRERSYIHDNDVVGAILRSTWSLNISSGAELDLFESRDYR